MVKGLRMWKRGEKGSGRKVKVKSERDKRTEER
jgi:hypothetical protein